MYNCLGARKRFIFIYYLFNMCMQQKRNVGTKFDKVKGKIHLGQIPTTSRVV